MIPAQILNTSSIMALMAAVEGLCIDEAILTAIREGAVIAFSLSGGKDSTTAAHVANKILDLLGHPRSDRVAIHADLGKAEWKQTMAMVEEVARDLGVRLMVVRHGRHDMVSRWEARFTEGKRRYANLEVFNLIGPWSSASLRFCTAEMKQQVIAPALQKAFPGRTIISVVGIRRAESDARANAPISKSEPRWSQSNGTRLLTWHPIVTMSTPDVFAYHHRHELRLHEGYVEFDMGRIGCAFCVMQNIADTRNSARCASNRPLLHHLVSIEADSTYSFQPTRWLADATPELIPTALMADVDRAKAKAAERRTLEANLPSGLRYVKGWPPRMPTFAEAEQIVAARAVILGQHGLEVIYPTPHDVIARFGALMLAQITKAAAKESAANVKAVRAAAKLVQAA